MPENYVFNLWHSLPRRFHLIELGEKQRNSLAETRWTHWKKRRKKASAFTPCYQNSLCKTTECNLPSLEEEWMPSLEISCVCGEK